MAREWQIAASDESAVHGLASSLSIPAIVARILFNRGVKNAAEGGRFLKKSIHDLVPPMEMAGMSDAADRLVRAIQGGEKLLVHGDFDADGITAASVLTRAFREMGGDVIPFVPDRLTEGHGISMRAVKRSVEERVGLVITCDCGSSSVKEVAELAGAGIQTIITDHHALPEELPSAILVNPKLTKGSDELSGVGVAFMLATALRARLRDAGHFQGAEPNMKNYLDLVALGTLADLAPLTGSNRILVAHGLEMLRSSSRPGIVAMRQKAGIVEGKEVLAEDVGFRLAPRLNAAARLGHSEEALRLLLTDSAAEADQLAGDLELWNAERKLIQARMWRLAEESARAQASAGRRSIVVRSNEFHPGVVGLLAQKLVEEFGLPAFAFATQGVTARGSVRGPAGSHLLEAMDRCRELLIGYGGHDQAGGCTLVSEKIDEFAAKFDAAVAVQGCGAMRKVFVDASLELGHVTEGLISSLTSIRPCGVGNPEPVFFARARVVAAREVGKGHLRATLVAPKGETHSAIGFNLWEELGSRMRGDVEVAYTPELNAWNGRLSVQLRLHAARSV